MINTENGVVHMEGLTSELASDMLSIMQAFNLGVNEGVYTDDVIFAMFESSPETITTFTKNFVKATHKA